MEENHKIDKFEKLYILISAQEATRESGIDLVSEDFLEEDFENIKTLAEYKMDNKDLFSSETGKIKEQDYNYYVIPQTKKIKIRNGLEEILSEKKINILSDNVGNCLYIVMEEGSVSLTKQFQKEIVFAKERYKNEIEKGVIPSNFIDDFFKVNSIEDVAELLNNNEFTLENIQDKIDQILISKGFITELSDLDKEVVEEKQDEEKEELEQDEELDEEQSERSDEQDEEQSEYDEEQDEEQTIEERAIELGVSTDFLQMIAQKYQCKPKQIDFRKIDNFEKIQEDVGINLRRFRGKIVALKIRYGYQERYFLINAETGERYQPNIHDNGNIPELKEYFKYRNRSGENSRSLRKDEGRSYITYLDEYGNMKEMKYINNGRKDDMEKEERERYIAEVKEANEILQDVIDVYQKECTQENWLKVKDAMKSRIDVDRKYRIKERGFREQVRSTKDTLYEVVDETVKKNPIIEKEER